MPFVIGKLENLSLRELWRHEEHDFTPWLAENISELSDLLGVPIIVDQTEHRVGNYELDILGHVEETDEVVIIENQLGTTDHGHLGQLLAYAAGLEAAIIVWVAAEVRDEHRSAIEWLNNHTDDRTSFFLVRPEVIRIDDSKPAVRFQLESSPSEFARHLQGIAASSNRASHEFRLTFWGGLLEYLKARGNPWANGRSTSKDAWIAFGVGRSGIGAHVSMATGSRIRVEVYLSQDSDKTNFDLLQEHCADIEALFPGEAVSWERLDGRLASRVAVYRPYDKAKVADATTEREELFSWIAKNLQLFRTVARKYLVTPASNTQ
ncbi:MAG: DUF4268 domain-containing protein [Gemmatimonadaceae bacterium]